MLIEVDGLQHAKEHRRARRHPRRTVAALRRTGASGTGRIHPPRARRRDGRLAQGRGARRPQLRATVGPTSGSWVCTTWALHHAGPGFEWLALVWPSPAGRPRVAAVIGSPDRTASASAGRPHPRIWHGESQGQHALTLLQFVDEVLGAARENIDSSASSGVTHAGDVRAEQRVVRCRLSRVAAWELICTGATGRRHLRTSSRRCCGPTLQVSSRLRSWSCLREAWSGG